MNCFPLRKYNFSDDDRADLRSQVTVFLISVGEPTYPQALEALRNQNTLFEENVILNVFPSGAAFQQMLEKCKTQYFIQCDADMILHGDAVLLMWNTIRMSSPTTAFCVFPLWDVHTCTWTFGVKIYKNKIMKRFPYTQGAAVEWNQVKRLRDAGYSFEFSMDNSLSNCLGYHGTQYTFSTAYERYLSLAEKHRLYGEIKWLPKYYSIFYRRMFYGGTDADLGALCGMLVGNITPHEDLSRPKDATEYSILKGLQGCRENLPQISDALKDRRGFAEAVYFYSGLPHTQRQINFAVMQLEGKA